MCFNISRVGSDQVKKNVAGRVGARGFKISWVGSGLVGSGQEVLKSRGPGGVKSRGFETSRVGSGHDPRETDHSRLKPPWPAGCCWLTRGSNLRIRPADSSFFQIYNCLQEGSYCCVVAPGAVHENPTRGSENDTKLAASCARASLVPGRYSDRMLS